MYIRKCDTCGQNAEACETCFTRHGGSWPDRYEPLVSEETRRRGIIGELLAISRFTIDEFIEHHGLTICCLLLGWQGGTVHGVKKELTALRDNYKKNIAAYRKEIKEGL